VQAIRKRCVFLNTPPWGVEYRTRVCIGRARVWVASDRARQAAAKLPYLPQPYAYLPQPYTYLAAFYLYYFQHGVRTTLRTERACYAD
jgi:hypothetical protein